MKLKSDIFRVPLKIIVLLYHCTTKNIINVISEMSSIPRERYYDFSEELRVNRYKWKMLYLCTFEIDSCGFCLSFYLSKFCAI